MVKQARKRAEGLNTKAESYRRRLEQEIAELEETTKRAKEKCRELLTQALEAVERSEALTAPKEQPKKLPSLLEQLTDGLPD